MQRQLVEHVEVWGYAIEDGGRRYTAYITHNLITDRYRWALWQRNGEPTSFHEPSAECTSLDESLAQIGSYIRRPNHDTNQIKNRKEPIDTDPSDRETRAGGIGASHPRPQSSPRAMGGRFHAPKEGITMDRMTAIKVAGNLAQLEYLLCRLEEHSGNWIAYIMSVAGDPLYTINTNEEAELYLDELWEKDEDS